MKTKKARTAAIGRLILGAVLGIMAHHLLVATAGDLEPSAPPGPTMKTLDEVEARIPIPGSATPTGTYVITSPGSYYLTGDRHANGGGITVTVDNVTIDLNGYSLIGGGYDIYTGVYMNLENNVEIRNGTIRNFQAAIYESNSDARNHRVIDVRAVSNSKKGIHLNGSGHVVKDCTASDNGASASDDVYGIYVGTNSIVTGNTARNNGNSCGGDVFGIYAGLGSTVTGNAVRGNGDSATGSRVYGIYADIGCTVIANTACRNGIGATGTGYGIFTRGSNLVDQNTAYSSGTNMNIEGTGTYGVNEY
jgi:hypothetical protein